MNTILSIPKSLIHEEINGKPIYKKGYKDFLLGLKKIEEINMGSSKLQAAILSILQEFLVLKGIASKYRILNSEVGLHLATGTNFSSDFAIYLKSTLDLNKDPFNYSDIPPEIALEVDLDIEIENQSPYNKYVTIKTERLLEWGVKKVIWVFTSNQQILIADNLKRWEYISWDVPFEVVDAVMVNLQELMLENGYQIPPMEM